MLTGRRIDDETVLYEAVMSKKGDRSCIPSLLNRSTTAAFDRSPLPEGTMLVQLLEKFGSEQFELMAGHLQGILYGHFRRIGQFNKALLTGSPFEVDDHEEDSHRNCTFGQWYYAQKAPELTRNKEFIALGKIPLYVV